MNARGWSEGSSKGRVAWLRFGAVCCLAALTAAGCSDESDGDGPGAGGQLGDGGERGPQAGSSIAGNAVAGNAPNGGVGGGGGASGAAPGGSSAHAGETAAGAPSAGAGGEGGASRGGEGGEAGESGGSAPECLPDETCRVPADCDASHTCVGSATDEICVPEQDYCDPQPCVQRSAGCVDHRCLPALALGTTCESSHQCASGMCDRDSHICVEKPYYCGCEDDIDCGDGAICIPTLSSIDACGFQYQSKCVQSPAPEGGECNPPGCEPGLICAAEDPTGREYCHAPRLPLGAFCEPFVVDYNVNCAPGLYCGVDATSGNYVCQPRGGGGEDCPCLDGFACGTDQKCHALAAAGESCSVGTCKRGLRCVDAIADGACCAN